MLLHKLVHDADGDTRRLADLPIKITIHVGVQRIPRGPRCPFRRTDCDNQGSSDEDRWPHLWPIGFPLCSNLLHGESIGEE